MVTRRGGTLHMMPLLWLLLVVSWCDARHEGCRPTCLAKHGSNVTSCAADGGCAVTDTAPMLCSENCTLLGQASCNRAPNCRWISSRRACRFWCSTPWWCDSAMCDERCLSRNETCAERVDAADCVRNPSVPGYGGEVDWLNRGASDSCYWNETSQRCLALQQLSLGSGACSDITEETYCNLVGLGQSGRLCAWRNQTQQCGPLCGASNANCGAVSDCVYTALCGCRAVCSSFATAVDCETAGPPCYWAYGDGGSVSATCIAVTPGYWASASACQESTLFERYGNVCQLNCTVLGFNATPVCRHTNSRCYSRIYSAECAADCRSLYSDAVSCSAQPEECNWNNEAGLCFQQCVAQSWSTVTDNQVAKCALLGADSVASFPVCHLTHFFKTPAECNAEIGCHWNATSGACVVACNELPSESLCRAAWAPSSLQFAVSTSAWAYGFAACRWNGTACLDTPCPLEGGALDSPVCVVHQESGGLGSYSCETVLEGEDACVALGCAWLSQLPPSLIHFNRTRSRSTTRSRSGARQSSTEAQSSSITPTIPFARNLTLTRPVPVHPSTQGPSQPPPTQARSTKNATTATKTTRNLFRPHPAARRTPSRTASQEPPPLLKALPKDTDSATRERLVTAASSAATALVTAVFKLSPRQVAQPSVIAHITGLSGSDGCTHAFDTAGDSPDNEPAPEVYVVVWCASMGAGVTCPSTLGEWVGVTISASAFLVAALALFSCSTLTLSRGNSMTAVTEYITVGFGLILAFFGPSVTASATTVVAGVPALGSADAAAIACAVACVAVASLTAIAAAQNVGTQDSMSSTHSVWSRWCVGVRPILPEVHHSSSLSRFFVSVDLIMVHGTAAIGGVASVGLMGSSCRIAAWLSAILCVVCAFYVVLIRPLSWQTEQHLTALNYVATAFLSVLVAVAASRSSSSSTNVNGDEDTLTLAIEWLAFGLQFAFVLTSVVLAISSALWGEGADEETNPTAVAPLLSIPPRDESTKSAQHDRPQQEQQTPHYLQQQQHHDPSNKNPLLDVQHGRRQQL